MDGDRRKDDKKKENKQQEKRKCDDEVKITLFGTKKDSNSKIRKEESKADQIGHNLQTVNYNFRNKYKPYHDREYGVYYHRDCAAYNYRGYEIKEPKVVNNPVVSDSPTRWVQYMTHTERHPRKPPLMIYSPNDNSFVQIVLMALLLFLIINMVFSIMAFYVPGVQTTLRTPYDYIWIPPVFGVVFTIYMVLCSACPRAFPFGFILLIINVISMTWMCMYVTVQHETLGLIWALLSIIFTVLFLLCCAICDVDFRRGNFLFYTGLLSFIFAYILIWIIGDNDETLLPLLPRRENMLIFGVMVYCLCLILMLQLIIANRTVLLADDEYSIGTFMVYMCVPCLFMKLVAFLGLFEENK